MTGWKEKLALTTQRNRLEIVKARLSRRDMVRLDLVTGSGMLIAKSGLSARTESRDNSLNRDDRLLSSADMTPQSPPARPWAQELPRLPVKSSIDPHALSGGFPDGTTLIDGATKRVNHQLFTIDP